MYAMPTLLGLSCQAVTRAGSTDVGSIEKAVFCLSREWNECAGSEVRSPHYRS